MRVALGLAHQSSGNPERQLERLECEVERLDCLIGQVLKLARLHGEKKAGGVEGKCFKIVCAQNAFHGRTYGGMSATPQEKIQKGFRPLVPGFVFGELNHLQSFADLIDDHATATISIASSFPAKSTRSPTSAPISARASGA